MAQTRNRGIRILPQTVLWLRDVRDSAGLSVAQAAEKAGISTPKLYQLEDPSYRAGHEKKAIEKLLRAYGLDWPDFKQHQEEHCLPPDFLSLCDIFRIIDRQMIKAMRDKTILDNWELREIHGMLLSETARRQSLNVNSISQLLRGPTFLESLQHSLPEPSLKISMSSLLDHVSYEASTGEALSIDYPKLLWDCTCKQFTGSEDVCPIHAYKDVGSALTSSFRSGLVCFLFEGRAFLWKKLDDPAPKRFNPVILWPPSIDSMIMLQNLEADGLFGENVASLLDIGSGTGFLGIIAACRMSSVKRLTLSDWLLSPALFGAINWQLNMPKFRTVDFNLDIDLFATDIQKKHEVVICNPPYLPLVQGHEQLAIESAVAGTDLLIHVLQAAEKLARNRIYIQFSDLARPEVNSISKELGWEMDEVGVSREVPLRVTFLSGHENYLYKLHQDKDRRLRLAEDEGYQYYHKIRTYRINL